MFVGNHNSWQDIPFMCMTIGWRINHKIIAKAELTKVPILGKAIVQGGHVTVDRENRRGQIATLKTGMNWLKVCIFQPLS
jgi:1-acyl-sn-glycerol-3-phosphate acyltransferase